MSRENYSFIWIGRLLVLLTALASTACVSDASTSTKSDITRVEVHCTGARQPVEVTHKGKPITIVCRGNVELEGLAALNEHVFSQDTSGLASENFRAVQPGIFVVYSISPYSKCRLEFVSRSKNSKGWSENNWPGGFHSPCHSETFDLAGRQIKPGRYSPTSYPNFVGNLEIPKYRIENGNQVVFLD
jgi:Rieske Fe-S protein